MLEISQSIIVNVESAGTDYIGKYLKSKGNLREEADQGLEIKYWVDKLLEKRRIDLEDLENFLFDELFWGKRKNTRIYKLNSIRSIKMPKDWEKALSEEFDINCLDFKDILGTIPNRTNKKKIAAITSEINYKGDLNKLRILFVCFAEINDNGALKDTFVYYPMEIDFIKKCMIIKAWSRQKLADGSKPDETMDDIALLMSSSFNVKIQPYLTSHKSVLYNMSQGLLADIYKKVPTYNQIHLLENAMQRFQQEILETLQLKNKVQKNNNCSISKGVFDFEDEFQKVLEKLCISDFFYDVPFEEVWNLDGISTIISKIRFNDVEHVLTSLSGESKEIPIFCTKTFMALKKSMEDAEAVERLWITRKRNKGMLQLSYDATKEDYLSVRVLSNIHFNEEDFLTAEEIYKNYERGIVTKSTTEDQRNIV